MQIERLTVDSPSEPFPIYADPIGHLLRAHVGDTADRDAAVAHVLGVLSGYAYSDTATVAMMAGRKVAPDERDRLLAQSQRVDPNDPEWQKLSRRREWMRRWPGVMSV